MTRFVKIDRYYVNPDNITHIGSSSIGDFCYIYFNSEKNSCITVNRSAEEVVDLIYPRTELG